MDLVAKYINDGYTTNPDTPADDISHGNIVVSADHVSANVIFAMCMFIRGCVAWISLGRADISQ